MSSALKSAITSPTGPQNSTVPPQLNKPMHSQGSAPTTYGQPMSHIPQNLVNIPHNTPAHSGNVSNHNTNSAVHPPNHYSLNVPNASQHYGVSGAAHSALTTNNSNNGHGPQNVSNVPSSFNISPSKVPTYTPSHYQPPGSVYSNKPPSNIPLSQPIQPAQVPPLPDAIASSDKQQPQANGTEDKTLNLSDSNLDVPQNYCTTQSSKDKALSTPPVASQPITTAPATSTEKEQTQSFSTPPAEEKKVSPPAPEKKDHDIADKVSSEETTVVSSSSENAAPATIPSSETNAEKVVSTIQPAGTSSKNSEATSAIEPSSVTEPSSNETEAAPQAETAVVSSNVTTPTKSKDQANNQKTQKLATTPRSTSRKAKSPRPEAADSAKVAPKVVEVKSTNQQKSSPTSSVGKIKRNRIRTQPYQSPLPEVELISKISATTPKNKNTEEKLIVFYKNEFLAVRNSEGGFYICQAVQNIYKSSHKIRIRWLSQDKNDKEIYIPDFYDHTDFDCILTNLNLTRVNKDRYKLPPKEKVRTDSILKRALDVEKGEAVPPSPTEEHPDGLDLSLYKEESQLKKQSRKRKATTSISNTTSSPSTSTTKSPDQVKVRKVVSKMPQAKKVTVLKKALSTKVKSSKTAALPERSSKRKEVVSSPASNKTSPVIDQKKAKVLAKVVARKTTTPAKTIKASPKSSNKQVAPSKKAVNTSATASSSNKKEKTATPVTTRKSKRGKK